MSKRDSIIGLLELFASEEEQLAYERDVPHVDITAELICMWFDDQYQPERGFDTIFSPDEVTALSKFHQFYDERVNQLPNSLGTVRTWLADTVWREIMKEAQTTLQQITEQAGISNSG